MNPDLYVVQKVNGVAGKYRSFDLMMDLITRYGHWAFVIYGLLLWFMPGKDREKRRTCCILAFLGVCIASLISYGIGKVWFRKRPFTKDWRIWNFTGHKANASFPSNHTMNGAVVVLSLLQQHMPGSRLMTLLAGILAFSRIFAGMHYPTDVLGGVAIAGVVHGVLHHQAVVTCVKPVVRFCSCLSDTLFSFLKK